MELWGALTLEEIILHAWYYVIIMKLWQNWIEFSKYWSFTDRKILWTVLRPLGFVVRVSEDNYWNIQCLNNLKTPKKRIWGGLKVNITKPYVIAIRLTKQSDYKSESRFTTGNAFRDASIIFFFKRTADISQTFSNSSLPFWQLVATRREWEICNLRHFSEMFLTHRLPL